MPHGNNLAGLSDTLVFAPKSNNKENEVFNAVSIVSKSLLLLLLLLVLGLLLSFLSLFMFFSLLLLLLLLLLFHLLFPFPVTEPEKLRTSPVQSSMHTQETSFHMLVKRTCQQPLYPYSGIVASTGGPFQQVARPVCESWIKTNTQKLFQAAQTGDE